MFFARFRMFFYPLEAIFQLYRHGFSIMSAQSRLLWAIALIKLFIMFGILKVFFFKDFLKTNFDTDEQRIEYLQEKFTEIEK